MLNIMTDPNNVFIGGIDSHKETICVAIITTLGELVTTQVFPTTNTGYQQALKWLTSHGKIQTVGVEGTSSYGSGITHTLTQAGISVIEVNRTRPAERRRQGKTDPLDAYRAARSVLSGEATTPPKNQSIEPLRALNIARKTAVQTQQKILRQIEAILISAPPHLRDKYRNLGKTKLIKTLANTRPDQHQNPDEANILYALWTLTHRHQNLDQEINALTQRLEALTNKINPALLTIKGIGPIIATQIIITVGDNPHRLRSSASLAALCGVAPVPVSSGKHSRHRLSRGGDRAANAALYQIVKVRLSCDPRTKTYWKEHREKRWTPAMIFRALKRAIIKEIYRALTQKCEIPDYSDLRPTRQAKNITITTAAQHLKVHPARIGELERGKRKNPELAKQYRQWLKTA